MKTINSYYPYIFIGILCLGIALRLIGLNRGLWLDEIYAIDIASSDKLTQALQTHDYPPSYFFLLRFWLGINTSEPFLRMLSVLLGVLTIVITMVWIRPFSRSASLLSGFFVATSPVLLRYSQEVQAYPLLIFSVTSAFYCAHKISNEKDNLRWYVFLMAALSISVTSHMVGIMTIASVCIYLIPAILRDKNNFQWGKLLISLIVPIIIFVASYFTFVSTDKGDSWWVPPITVDFLLSQFKYIFGNNALTVLAQALSNYHLALPVPYWWLIDLTAIFCFGFLLFFGDWHRSWNALGAAGIFWIQILVYSLVFLPILVYRTIMPGIIPFIVFVSMQTATIKRKNLRVITMAGLSLISLLSAIGWTMSEARFPKETWNQAGQFLESEYQPDQLVIFYPPYIEGPTRYYFPSLLDNNAIPLNLGTDIETIRNELENQMIIREGKETPFVLYLVVRHDMLVENDKTTYDDFLTYLGSSATPAYPPKEFLDISVSKYEFHH